MKAATVGALLGALVLAASAQAMSGSQGVSSGKVRIFADASSDGPVSKILITGAIGDYGTATSIDKNGKVDQNGNYVKIALKKGTFEVDSTTLNANMNKAPAVFNKTTCSFSLTGTGPVKLFNGTGLYKGISGSAEITLSFGGIAPRLTSGAHKGDCNPNQNAKALSQYGAIIGTGTVKFSAA
jgi:hypothetical protein